MPGVYACSRKPAAQGYLSGDRRRQEGVRLAGRWRGRDRLCNVQRADSSRRRVPPSSTAWRGLCIALYSAENIDKSLFLIKVDELILSSHILRFHCFCQSVIQLLAVAQLKQQ